MAFVLLGCAASLIGVPKSSGAAFAELGLCPQLASAAAQQAWACPTNIQLQAIPPILAGSDVWAEAPTGSGKTGAFALPLLQQVIEGGRQRRGRTQIHTLVLSPTRELAVQTAATFEALIGNRDAKVLALHGGVSINPQLRSLGGGADVVIATPGRLLDILEHNGASIAGVRTLLLDEADRLLASQFGLEMDAILERLPPAPARQTLLFSATFPFQARPKARRLLSETFVRLADACTEGGEERAGDGAGAHAERRRRPSNAERYASAAPPPTIAQRAICVDERERTRLLRHLIAAEGWARVLVFVGSRRRAEHVASKLQKAGVAATTLHGGLSQEVRTERLAALRASELRVLVATDLAARGLDVHGLEAIVNYELPRSTADYTHRVGRTGRAGEAGVAVSFVASTGAANEAHFALIERRHGGMRVPREVLAGFEPKAVDRLFPAAAAGSAHGAPSVDVLATAPAGDAEAAWAVPGVQHSSLGLAHDRMHGGVKGRRMSKKDKLRAAAAAAPSRRGG